MARHFNDFSSTLVAGNELELPPALTVFNHHVDGVERCPAHSKESYHSHHHNDSPLLIPGPKGFIVLVTMATKYKVTVKEV